MPNIENHLTEKIKTQAIQNPIRLDHYMALCLADEKHGYYTYGDRLGKKGDFITAPEISQLFGEIIAAWLIHHYQQKRLSGQKTSFVEIGAGKGSLMRDILTHIENLAPDIYESASFHIIETSKTFTKIQQETLHDKSVTWHQTIDELPDNFLILWGNEFLDALPIRQFHRYEHQWLETHISFNEKNQQWHFCHNPLTHFLPDYLKNIQADDRQWLEFSPAAIHFCDYLAKYLKQKDGFALFIDYGNTEIVQHTPTLQAVKNHQFANIFDAIGETDLTAHVNFALLNHIFTDYQLNVEFYNQKYFLTTFGICERAEQLITQNPEHAKKITQDLHRLIDDTQMGDLFKIMTINI